MEIRKGITVENGWVLVNGQKESDYIGPLLPHELKSAKQINANATHRAGRLLFSKEEYALIKSEMKKYKERHLPNLSRLIELKREIIDAKIKNEMIFEESLEEGISYEKSVNFDQLKKEYDSLITDRCKLYLSLIEESNKSNFEISGNAKKIMKMLEDGIELQECLNKYKELNKSFCANLID